MYSELRFYCSSCRIIWAWGERTVEKNYVCKALMQRFSLESCHPKHLTIFIADWNTVSKSQMFLRNNADDSVCCTKQLHRTWGYGSWENSCLILQSSMVNRKNIDPHHWQNTKGEKNSTNSMLSCFTKERVLLGAVWVPAQTQTNT